MHRLVDGFLIAMLCLAPMGCIPGYIDTRFKDVTTDPRFAFGYHVGESYRLRRDTRLIAMKYGPFGNTERFELWSPQDIANDWRHQSGARTVAEVPAGTLIHVDGRDYSHMFAIPPVLGMDLDVLYAYGTIKCSAGSWSHVQLPNDQDVTKWSWIPGASVLRPLPDLDSLEPVTPTTSSATVH